MQQPPNLAKATPPPTPLVRSWHRVPADWTQVAQLTQVTHIQPLNNATCVVKVGAGQAITIPALRKALQTIKT